MRPLSEQLRAISKGLMSATRCRIPSAEELGECADRAAALEAEVAELLALREALAEWWDPVGAGPDWWTAENARAQLAHLERNIDAMGEAAEEAEELVARLNYRRSPDTPGVRAIAREMNRRGGGPR